MIERGELTADEQRQAAAQFEDKLQQLLAVKPPPGSATARAADAVRAKLEQSVRGTKPFVRELEHAREIAGLERELAALAELENPREPLPLAEVCRLNAKPRLLERLAQLRAASRGWFAEATH